MKKDKLIKIAKGSCLVSGFALYGVAAYLYYYKGISNYMSGNYESAVKYILISNPTFLTSQILLVTSGFMYKEKLKKWYLKAKDCIVGRKKSLEKNIEEEDNKKIIKNEKSLQAL